MTEVFVEQSLASLGFANDIIKYMTFIYILLSKPKSHIKDRWLICSLGILLSYFHSYVLHRTLFYDLHILGLRAHTKTYILSIRRTYLYRKFTRRAILNKKQMHIFWQYLLTRKWRKKEKKRKNSEVKQSEW